MELNHTIHFAADKQCRVTIGSWPEVVAPYGLLLRTIAIVDSKVAASCDLYEYFHEVVVIEGGEGVKSIDVARGLWESLVEVGADRHTLLVGVGGGTVTDLVAFVASTFMRGLKFLLLPTTLLGQVDAAIGGKCGVNFGGYKNMVGAFSLPEEVVCDPQWLRTLPEREWRCGMAEIIKTAIVGDAELFELLENSTLEMVMSDDDLLAEIVAHSVAVKCRVVNEDFRESGLRRVLNLGHTMAHAIESRTEQYSHGEAVAVGIAYVARMATDRGELSAEDCGRIVNLLERYGLPTSVELDMESLREAMMHDKKNKNGEIGWVVPRNIGSMI